MVALTAADPAEAQGAEVARSEGEADRSGVRGAAVAAPMVVRSEVAAGVADLSADRSEEAVAGFPSHRLPSALAPDQLARAAPARTWCVHARRRSMARTPPPTREMNNPIPGS